MGFVIKSSVAHVLRIGWKNKKAREFFIFLKKSNGYSNSNKLLVLKNNWYFKE